MKKIKFSDLYTISSGISSTKEQAGHGSPFLSFSTVFNNFFIPDKLEDLMDTSESEQKTYSIKSGDIFLTRTSEVIDELAMSSVALKDYPNATYSGFLKRLRPIDGLKTYPKFMAFYLRTPLFRKTITNNATMTLRASFNETIFSYLDLLLPDYSEQKKIGDFLYLINQKIALNKQINARLEEMAKTLYDYWFVQFDFPDTDGKPYKSSGGEMVFDETLKREIPKGWEVKSLGEVISLERGVTYSKDSICNDKNGTGVLRATNISGNNIDLNDLIYISGDVDTQQKLKPFDILIVMSSGSKEHIGKNGVYYFEQDNAFGAFCSKITPQKVFFEFVSIFLQSNNFRNYVKNQCLGTNINNLNNSHILHCPIVRPNDEYIEAFHKQIKLIYEKISCNVKQNHQLTQLRDFLLPMLMNGQVSVAE